MSAAPDQSCESSLLERLVGQPATVLEAMDLAENVRVLRPMRPATTDHRPERINIEINSDEIITRIWCG